MSVTDLVGSSRGDVAGLSALASRLRRAAVVLACDERVAAVRAAAVAVEGAASALRELPVSAPQHRVHEVEAGLARVLAGPLALLDREGTR